MIDHFEPGQQALIELGQAGQVGRFEFGQEIGPNEAKKAFDFAASFRVVRGAQNALDAEAGTDHIKLLGGVDTAAIDIDRPRQAIADNGPFETILHAGQLLVPVKLGVRHQAGMVVEESKEEDLTGLVGLSRIRQPGAVHSIALPQVAKGRALKTTIGLGSLLS